MDILLCLAASPSNTITLGQQIKAWYLKFSFWFDKYQKLAWTNESHEGYKTTYLAWFCMFWSQPNLIFVPIVKMFAN